MGISFLTNELRLHEKIQGYIYTELSDIEWEHNGFYNYDRSAKEFGYDAFVPGMTTRDMQGEDFVGYDDPPMVKATAFTCPSSSAIFPPAPVSRPCAGGSPAPTISALRSPLLRKHCL